MARVLVGYYVKPSMAEIDPAKENNRPRLGELLVHAGLIREQILEECLNHQWRWGGRIGEILVEQGHVTSAQLLWALSIQLNLDAVDLPSYNIDTDAVSMLPNTFARTHRCIAIDFITVEAERRLVVATADPTIRNLDGLIFEASGLKPVFKIASEDTVWDAIGAYYRHQESILPRAADMASNPTDITSLLNVPSDIASRIYTAEQPIDDEVESITHPTLARATTTQASRFSFTPEMILSLEPHELVELARRLIEEGRLRESDFRAVHKDWMG